MVSDAVRVSSSAVMVAVVGERVVRIAPTDAVRVRLVPLKSIAEVMLMSPVVWVREREFELSVEVR